MIRKRLTFANVTSLLALFVALSAGSYAAIKLPANSVGSKQIKKNAVTGAKIKANAITSDKIADGAVSGADINPANLGKVPAAASADSAGIARVKQVTAAGANTPAPAGGFSQTGATATCDAGLTAVGGGVAVSDKDNQAIVDSYPSSATAWTADVYNIGSGSPGFTVYAICAPAASTQ